MARSVLERLRERVGDAGMVADAGLAWMERQHKQAIDMDIPVVSKVTEAVLQPAVLGARVALANLTSGGGKYYQPEVRDERYFSNNALRELGQSVKHMRGTSGRADGMDNAAQFNLTQTIGGFSVRNGNVTDSFDINKSYATVPQPLTNVARAVLGREEDPDRGKVRTEIPLDRLGGRVRDTGGPETLIDMPRPGGQNGFWRRSDFGSVTYVGEDGKAYQPMIAVRGPSRVIREGDNPSAFGDVKRYGWDKPNEWFAHSKEVPGTGKNVYGEPVNRRDREETSMASKAGASAARSGMANFLATDKVPDTIFGIPVVSRKEDYTERDIEFFKEHPEAGGYYDMEDGNEDTSSAEEVPAQGLGEVQPGEPAGEGVPQMAAKGGDAGVDLNTYMYTATNDLDRVVIDPKNIKGTGIAYDAVKDRVQIKPEDRKEFEGWLDYIAGLDPTMKKQRLVPPDWRTNPYWASADGYQRDYDFGAAFYEGKKYDDPLTSMVKMESDGLYHLDDRGKAPNHPTFSKHSHYYLDDNLRAKYGALAGDWSKGSNGEWRYVPGEAERKVPKGTIRTKRELMKQQTAKGGMTRGKYPGIWNNPGNVRPGAVDYAGQTGTALSKKGSGRFLTFDTPQSGLNSMSNVISQIVRVKIPDRFAKGELASDKFTTRNLVSVYSPPSENNTSEYVDFVSKRLGVKPDDELSMSDSETMAKLIDTMVRHESGHKHADWFTKDEYRKAAEMMKGAK